MLKSKKSLIAIFFFICLAFPLPLAQARTLKIATYNVENLFDLDKSGNEYVEYIPNSIFNWNKDTFSKKINNIATVIKDLNADIIALQEIESKTAMETLRKEIMNKSLEYKYAAIANSKNTTVKCALFSKWPIEKIEEVFVYNIKMRNILKVHILIDSSPLIVYVNHWKSKRGPESLRIQSALALREDIDKLEAGTDFIILGDFNANYDEYKTIAKIKSLNNTQGITGINHILKTINDSQLVAEDFLSGQKNNVYLYNLWLEIPKEQRWSYDSFHGKDSPDAIIIGYGLYDDKGISYIDNSFNRFTPDYLFRQGKIFRWQIDKRWSGMHMGLGYSDHLPIFALFSTQPFEKLEDIKRSIVPPQAEDKTIASLHGFVDLNTATKKELMAIKGIGTILSDKIIAARPYNSIDDLLRVNGIGKKKLKSMRKYFKIQNKQRQ